MAQSDYEDGLRGNQNFLRTGKEKRDWEAGYQAYLANKDMADRIRETNEEDRAARKSDAEDEANRNDPSYNRIRAAVERKMENEGVLPWLEFFFWRLPKFLFDAIANLFSKPISNDDLYYEIITTLMLARKATSAAGFDECVRDLRPYVDEALKREEKRLNSAQRVYVDAVCKECGLKVEKVRSIIDQLPERIESRATALSYKATLSELDGVFRPICVRRGIHAFYNSLAAANGEARRYKE